MAVDSTTADRAAQIADISRLTDIASQLAIELTAPAQFHSVFVNTTATAGKFVNSICVSVRPDGEHLMIVPQEFQGERIKRVAWPD